MRQRLIELGFLSTLSLRRATRADSFPNAPPKFLSTLSLRRATARRASRQQPAGISIHALLAESDANSQQEKNNGHEFLSTLSLRRATRVHWFSLIFDIFLSTLSLRRATHYDNYNLHCVEISIHALLAESDTGQKRLRQKLAISIHALLAESDFGRAFWPGLSL